MIQYKRIFTDKDSLFQFGWELYEASFPEVERRGKDYHIETMKLEQFHAEIVLDDDLPIGILFWWDLNNFRYVEHLATTSTQRGKGYGNTILNNFIALSDKPILLEVEHPTDDLSRRRIGFYERIGFVLNNHPYSQPSYQQIKDTFVNLMVMTYPRAISSDELQKFINEEFSVIHFRNFL
ncbi:MAG: GNAT family N-acetyltransferase [Rikenellaceae bacterium]